MVMGYAGTRREGGRVHKPIRKKENHYHSQSGWIFLHFPVLFDRLLPSVMSYESSSREGVSMHDVRKMLGFSSPPLSRTYLRNLPYVFLLFWVPSPPPWVRTSHIGAPWDQKLSSSSFSWSLLPLRTILIISTCACGILSFFGVPHGGEVWE